MATVLRKMWWYRGSSSGGSSKNTEAETSSTLGDLERIPMDIIMQIVRLVGPKDAAKLSLVCKCWRRIVSDNRLWMFFLQTRHHASWDSLVFAETNLRFGYPLQGLSSNFTRELSFMRIYGERELVPGAVIIDGGSGYCKYGWSKYDSPSGRCATFLEFGNIESPMLARLRNFFDTIYHRMQVRASSHPIVVSLPMCHYDDTESAKASRRQLREAICKALFDLHVPAVCAINQATLALYAARRTSGIVVNIGFQVTSVVPILQGKVMRKIGVEVIGIGALKVTGFLREQMQQNNVGFESIYTIRTLKENLCYVALDYQAELLKNTEASFEVPGEGWFTLSKERFKTGEILFQPRIAGVRAMGLHQAVALCMDHCHASGLTVDDTWFKTIVLSGGTACLPGLPERLERELQGLLSPSVFHGVNFIPPPYGAETIWFGAKAVSNLSTFSSNWCVTKKQFRPKSRFNLAW